MQDADLCMVLLAAQPDAFFRLSGAGQQLSAELEAVGAVQVHNKPAFQNLSG